LDILQKSGLKVMFNGDWTEQSLLEKPNGLSFLVLYTDSIPRRIQSLAKLKRIQRYFGFSQNDTKNSQRSYVPRSMVRTTRRKLGALFLKDAQADYLWRDKGLDPCLLRLF
jgi:iron complex transport system substrate-binding protein